MEYQKILGKTTDSTKLPKFITRKWIELFDQSNNVYNPHKEVICVILMMLTLL